MTIEATLQAFLSTESYAIAYRSSSTVCGHSEGHKHVAVVLENRAFRKAQSGEYAVVLCGWVCSGSGFFVLYSSLTPLAPTNSTKKQSPNGLLMPRSS